MTTVRFLLLGLVLASLAPAVRGQDTGEIPLSIEVGKTASLCPCPVRGAMCDDPSLVEIVDEGGKTALRGKRPGSTVCSVFTPTSLRRVYRVKVEPPGGGGQPDGGRPDGGR
jgi:hypothetical protein